MPERRVCRLAGQHRSTQRYQAVVPSSTLGQAVGYLGGGRRKDNHDAPEGSIGGDGVRATSVEWFDADGKAAVDGTESCSVE